MIQAASVRRVLVRSLVLVLLTQSVSPSSAPKLSSEEKNHKPGAGPLRAYSGSLPGWAYSQALSPAHTTLQQRQADQQVWPSTVVSPVDSYVEGRARVNSLLPAVEPAGEKRAVARVGLAGTRPGTAQLGSGGRIAPAEAVLMRAALVRRIGTLSGRIEGSAHQVTGSDVTLNGGSVITGDLLAPGTPSITINGKPAYGGTVDSGGSAEPSNYTVTLNGNAELRHVVRRSDPVALPQVTAPPPATGTRDLILNSAGDDPGDFSTIRDLTLNGNAGLVTVPPGAYRDFTAGGNNGFILGVAGATRPAFYNLNRLTLNGNSRLTVAGPVRINLGASLMLNGSMGDPSHPLWLTLKIAMGGVTLNGGASLRGVVIAPSGEVIINGNSELIGSVFCDKLTVNGGGVLRAAADITGPAITITQPAEGAIIKEPQTTVTGTVSDETETTVTVNSIGAAITGGNYSAVVPLNEGPNTLTATATDLFGNTAQATRNVIRPFNQAPVVSAGADQTIMLPGNVVLNGTVADDGLPLGATLSISWSKVSGPGAVTFSDPAAPVTTASFTVAGSYTLRLTASDSLLTGVDDVNVTVHPPNQAPIVNAGTDQTVPLPNAANLNGSVNDDGLPPGASLTITWSKVSGLGEVTFANPNAPVTTASFGATGSYVLRLTASDSALTGSDDLNITVQPGGPPPVSAFTVPGVPRPVLSTISAASGSNAANLLDNNAFTFWSGAQSTNQSVTIRFTSTGEQLVDRVQLQAAFGSINSATVRDFEVQLSLSENEADFVTVLSATLANSGKLQEFVFPGGPARARYARLIAKNTHGGSPMTLGTFQVVALGAVDNIISLPGRTNVARIESPSLLMNGGQVLDFSTQPGNTPDLIFTFNSSSAGWKTENDANQFALMELAGGKSYTLRGIKLTSLGVEDFEVWVSSTTADATAFTRVLSATASSQAIQTFLFPGGPVQARYVKYVPLNSGNPAVQPATSFLDVIADDVARVVDVSSVFGGQHIAERAFDEDAATVWTAQQNTNQWIKFLLSGGRTHRVFGIRITSSTVKNFEVRVSATTSDDAAFTTVFSGAAQSLTAAQEFRFTSQVDARYVQFFFKDSQSTSPLSAASLEVLAFPSEGSLVNRFTSETANSEAHRALDIDSSNGQWLSAVGQNANQSLVLTLPGSDPWLIDQVVLEPGRNSSFGDTTIAAKNFDLLVSTTDDADQSFSTVFSGTLQNVSIPQHFSFPAVQARFIKLLVKDNYGNAANLALNSFFAVSPQLGSTTARFMDRSTIASGRIASYAWDFGDGGTSTERDPVHQYAAAGVYTVSLTVTNESGQSNTSQILYHALEPLKADFGFSPLHASETLDTVRFFDLSSRRLSPLTTRTWDLGNGSVATGGSFPFIYVDSGAFQTSLTIGNPSGIRLTATKPLVVLNLPPTVSPIQSQTLVWGETWTPNLTFPAISDPSAIDQQSLRCGWSFGDGQSTEITACTSAKANLTHVYALPGDYTATLTVFDKDGGVTSASAVNVVTKRPTALDTLHLDGPAANGTIKLAAVLIDDFAKTPLAGKTVEFRVLDSIATAVTDTNGAATAQLAYTPGVESALATVSYAGDELYAAGAAAIEVAGRPGVRRCTTDSRGTDFWINFPGTIARAPSLQLMISGDTATTGTVSAAFPGFPFNASFTVQPGAITTVNIPLNALPVDSTNPEQISTRGIHVTAGAPVSVYGLELFGTGTEAFTALPTQSLGVEYIVLSYKNVNISNTAQFSIAAGNTVVTITLPVNVGERIAGVPYTFTLNQGETYSILDTNQFPSDLSGTIITSDKPIAVYGGHRGANVPTTVEAANPLFEQLPSSASWARSFALMPSATRTKGDTVRCLASTDNTRVYFNGALAGTINRGEFVERIITGPTHILSDQPILVAQYANSSVFDFVTGDPYMLIHPGVNQFLDHYTVTTPSNGFNINFINVVAPNSAVGSVTLDGVPIAPSSFTPIGQSGYSGAQVAVAVGAHTLAGPEPFGISSYGFAFFDAYAYPGGYCVTSAVTSIQMTLAPQSANNATGVQDCVTATVTDLNGTPMAGVRVNFNVTGVNAALGSTVTDANGQAQFCYTGTNAGSDLITVVAAGFTATAAKTWGGAANQPPAVSAGAGQTITLPTNTVTLNGTVQDDGLPLDGQLMVNWSQVSGPAGVVFADPAAAVTVATFPASGDYVLKLTATDGQLTSSATTAVTVKAAPVNQPPAVDAGFFVQTVFLEDNLLLNGDGEAALVSGQIPNWTMVTGSWTRASGGASGLPAAFNGSAFLSAAGVATAELKQDVDVRNWAGTIDASLQQFEFSGYVRSKEEQPTDSARVIIEYRDATNSFVLASLDTGPIVSTKEWSAVTDKRTAPSGTGFIRVRLIATRASGTTNDVFFDQLALRAVGRAATLMPGIVTDDGLPAGSSLESVWSKVSGPGEVRFADPSQPATTATFSTAGSYTLKLEASDSELTASEQIPLVVKVSNQAPVVSAGANQAITLPSPATLSGSVQDDGLPSATLTINWSVMSGPSGATVSFSSPNQLLTSASFSAAGSYVLKLTVSDGQYTSTSNVAIAVSAVVPVNQAPVVSAGMNQTTTMPFNTITLNGAVADDGLPAGAALVVSWSQVSGPAQATFSPPNAVSTSATFPVVGTYSLKLTASDGQLSSSATVQVTVNPQPPANQAPVVSAGPNQTITPPANTVTLNGSVQDDGLPEGSTLVIQWSQVSGPAPVIFATPNQAVTQAAFSAAGVYILQLSASDSEFTVTSQVAVTVNQAPVGGGEQLSVSFNGLDDGAVITSPTDITATISGGNWTLDYILNADEEASGDQFTTIASGSGAVTNAVIGRFDPTLLLNGTYLIRLTSRNSAGTGFTQTVSVVVRGQQKIGNFTLSFNDLTVPVAGLPIRVIRTYDSRDKRSGDFGVGWSLGIKNVRVEKSGVLGKQWDETQITGLIPKFCLEPRRPKLVTITFPDGRQYRFRAVTSPECQSAAPITGAEVTYVQVTQDNGTAGASLVAVGSNSVLVDAPVPGPVNLISTADQRIYNPKVFRLTTAEGTVYVIDEAVGVTSMTDLNGNTLTVNSNGIVHSSGKSILFTRDVQGRITKITDPNGNVLSYNIDAIGNLTGFTDAAGNITNFSYDDRHKLLTITDPRGIQPIRNEYDDSGRLIKHTDAFGKTISYTHHLSARQEIITDRLGNSTLHEYDSNGNVVRTVDPLGHETTYTYDARDNKLTETNAIGKTTTFTYDSADNLESETDPLGT